MGWRYCTAWTKSQRCTAIVKSIRLKFVSRRRNGGFPVVPLSRIFGNGKVTVRPIAFGFFRERRVEWTAGLGFRVRGGLIRALGAGIGGATARGDRW
jgi:hypothetical protein